MNPTEYQKLAARTECVQFVSRLRMNGSEVAPTYVATMPNQNESLKQIRVNHAIIGICGEVGELWELFNTGRSTDKDQMLLEGGDVLWYMAELMNALEIDMTGIVDSATTPYYEAHDHMKYGVAELSLHHMSHESGRLCAELQRWVYYGKYDGEYNGRDKIKTLYENIVYILKSLTGYLISFLAEYNLSLCVVMNANIAKLRARYPDKYTDSLAAEENRDRVKEEQMALDKKPEPIGDPELGKKFLAANGLNHDGTNKEENPHGRGRHKHKKEDADEYKPEQGPQ